MPHRHEMQHAVNPDVMVDHALTDLKAGGARVTRSRRLILRVLATHHEHLTADDVADALRDEGVHRTTVYRTLEFFTENNIVALRQLPGGAAAYHLATENHLHGHCIKCQDVISLPVDAFDDAIIRLKQARGFAFDPNRSSLFGICHRCLEAASEENESESDDVEEEAS